MAKNKVLKRVSKKTIGKSVDSVADYVDLISQMIAEYFNQRYKIEKKVDDIKRATYHALFTLKKEFIKTIIETLFLVTGLLALIVGSILYLSNFFFLEYILIFYGLIVTIGVLLHLKLDI